MTRSDALLQVKSILLRFPAAIRGLFSLKKRHLPPVKSQGKEASSLLARKCYSDRFYAEVVKSELGP